MRIRRLWVVLIPYYLFSFRFGLGYVNGLIVDATVASSDRNGVIIKAT